MYTYLLYSGNLHHTR